MKPLLIFLGSALFAGNVLAHPAPKLTSASREWIQRGTSGEITLSGEYLAEARQILVDGGAGVEAEIVPVTAPRIQVESPQGGITSVALPDDKQLRVRFEIDGGAALAERELRVVTPDGVSNPLTIRLSHLPELVASDNTSKDQALNVPLPAAVNGVIRSPAQSQFFRFTARRGEHVIVDIHASRMGSKLDSSLAIYDNEGRELARSEDAAGLDSVLDFTVPQDGEYLAELRDFRYQGGGDFKYRLLAGVMPHAFSSFPFGGRRGETVEVQLKGANLQGASKVLLHLAADGPVGRQEIRASTPLGLSNPFPLEVSDLPSIWEKEPNNSPNQFTEITLPAAINAKINKPGDTDGFRFRASQGQRVIFEVQAFRFGSPVDAVLILQDSHGSVLQRNDDAAGSDPRLEHTFKEAGQYSIIVQELLERGGEDFGYRLTAAIPKPDFSVAFLQDAVRVRRAGRIPIRCEVNRMNGFNAAVRIHCSDLPAGIYAEPLVLPPEAGSGLLVIHASPEAVLGSFPLRVNAVSGDETRAARVFRADRQVKASYLTVLEAAPFSIAPATLSATIQQNETGRIDLLVDRQSGFAAPVKITAEGFSAGREPISRSFEFQPVVIPPGESRGTLALKAKTDCEIGTRPIVLKAEAVVDGETLLGYAPLLPVTTVEIPFVLSTSLKKLFVTALAESSGSAASEAVFTVKADRRQGFSEAIELKIEGLPDGVNVASASIPANSTEATVQLAATEKAPTGKDVPVTITGSAMHNDRRYRFSPPPVTLTISAPEKSEQPKLANTTP